MVSKIIAVIAPDTLYSAATRSRR